ncbi:MAG: PAS domain-containing protein [Desulfuromonadales bacterium]|nr:PAS domain-containing protein [Desulfuromonadales bacterium]
MGQIIQNLLMFYALMEYSSDSIVFKEYFRDEKGGYTGGNFVSVSNEKARHYGMTPAQMKGKTDQDLLPSAEAAKSLKDDLWVMTHKRAIRDIRETITHPNGETVSVSVTKFPWFNQGGDIFGVICIARDISRRVEAEKQTDQLSEFLMRDMFQPLASIHSLIQNLESTPENKRIKKVYSQVFAKLCNIR